MGAPRTDDWDRLWARIEDPALRPMDSRIARALDEVFPVAGLSLLEIGCGSGLLLASLLELGATRAAGIDFSPEACARARERLRPWGERARVVEGDLFTADPGEAFDLVFSSGLLEHFFPESRKREVARRHAALTRGSVAIVVPARPHPNFLRYHLPAIRRKYGEQRPLSRRELERVLRGAGLRVLRTGRFFPLYGLPWVSKRECMNRLADRLCPHLWGGLWLSLAVPGEPHHQGSLPPNSRR